MHAPFAHAGWPRGVDGTRAEGVPDIALRRGSLSVSREPQRRGSLAADLTESGELGGSRGHTNRQGRLPSFQTNVAARSVTTCWRRRGGSACCVF